MNNLDFIKIKIFCSAKYTVKATQRQVTDWQEIFAKITSEKGLLSKIYRELLRNKKTTS